MAKILIVDDSALSRRAHRRILGTAGYAVGEAPDGLAALERYEFDKPGLALLDVTMAEMDGLEVPSQLRAMDLPALVMATAHVQSPARVLAGAAGGVAKPLTARAVLRVVDAALAGRVGGAK